MSAYEIYIVDAFTNSRFSGNPAAVCYLRGPNALTEKQMLQVAKEMNLSETAFFFAIDEPAGVYSLKWFTPKNEVKLCGHATLATSHVLFRHLKVSEKGVTKLTFRTLSGDLFVEQKEEGGLIEMDFPQELILKGFCKKIDLSDNELKTLSQKCGLNQKDILGTHFDDKSGKLIIEMISLDSFINAKVDTEGLLTMSFPFNIRGVSITSSSLPKTDQLKDCDFASRYFSPWNGIPEDPVNGSSHTILGTFYKKKLNKNSLVAYMASDRTGFLYITLKDLGRICISGYAVTTLTGAIRA